MGFDQTQQSAIIKWKSLIDKCSDYLHSIKKHLRFHFAHLRFHFAFISIDNFWSEGNLGNSILDLTKL